MALLRPPVRKHRSDFSIHLSADQSELLLRLLEELDLMLSDDSPENVERLARLFPPAYSGEPTTERKEAEEEYQRLMRDELVQSRRASITIVRDCLEHPRHLSEAQLTGFMQSVNALRLVLGTILQITDDPEDPNDPDASEAELDPEDPNVGLQMAYQFLSWILEWTVRALTP